MIQRLEGAVFKSKQAAEEHGLKLCKKWIDAEQVIGTHDR